MVERNNVYSQACGNVIHVVRVYAEHPASDALECSRMARESLLGAVLRCYLDIVFERRSSLGIGRVLSLAGRV